MKEEEEVTKEDLINALKDCEELVSKMEQGTDKTRRERLLRDTISEVEKYNGYPQGFFRSLLYKGILSFKETLLSEVK